MLYQREEFPGASWWMQPQTIPCDEGCWQLRIFSLPGAHHCLSAAAQGSMSEPAVHENTFHLLQCKAGSLPTYPITECCSVNLAEVVTICTVSTTLTYAISSARGQRSLHLRQRKNCLVIFVICTEITASSFIHGRGECWRERKEERREEEGRWGKGMFSWVKDPVERL